MLAWVAPGLSHAPNPLRCFPRTKQEKSHRVKAVLDLELSPAIIYEHLVTWIVVQGGVLDIGRHYRSFCDLVLSQEVHDMTLTDSKHHKQAKKDKTHHHRRHRMHS